jgi:L-ascorbate metabolism protein UlaG (beta-lactamase superfamily)
VSRALRRLKKIAKILAWTVAVLAIVGYGILQLPAFGGRFDGERLARMQKSPQWIAGRFQNSPPQRSGGSFWETVRLYRQGQIREPQFEIPVIALAPATLRTPPAPGLRAIWFGHSSVLVEIDGVRIMTDPVLSDVVSPVPIGPKRMHPPPRALAARAGIDAVLISHDHYDHLDMQTIRHLATRGTQFYVGLGVGAHLERWKVPAAQIHEMDWWQSLEINKVRIHCAPARHYSGRKRQDNSTLWASWLVESAHHSFYYSGDTGSSDLFRSINTRFGPTDLNLIKIGAYGTPPSWIDIHMDPQSAVRANQDLGGGVLLPVHWATFNLSYHAWDEPILRALRAAEAEHVQLVTPRVGEIVEIGQPFSNVEWYKARVQ